MLETLRLYRLSLALRILTALLGLAASLALFGNKMLLISAIALAPSCLLLLVTYVAQRRGWVTLPFMRALLASMIIIYTLEIVVTSIVFRYHMAGLSTADAERSADVWRRLAIMTANRRPQPGVPLLFILIPAILGAWLDGRKGALRWSVFTTLMSSFGLLVFGVMESSAATSPGFCSFGIGEFIAQATVIIVACYFVGSLADQQRAEQAKVESANRRLAAQAHMREQLAASRERVRLARDLHDTLAHTLAGLAVQINAIDAMLNGTQPEVRRELAYASRLAQEGLDNTRLAINDLRANLVADLGLAGALQRQTDLVGQRTGASASFDQQGELPDLDESVAAGLFHIAQEALNNVERHARARNISVSLRAQADRQPALALSIRDDGAGFDTGDLTDQRFGLRGMRERAELIGAHLRIKSVVGQGTEVLVTLP